MSRRKAEVLLQLPRHAALAVTAASKLPAGKHQARMEFAYDGGGLGKGAGITLYVDGTKVGEGRINRTHAFFFSMDETLEVGCDLGDPVSEDYPTRQRVQRQDQLGADRHRRRRQGCRPHGLAGGAVQPDDGAAINPSEVQMPRRARFLATTALMVTMSGPALAQGASPPARDDTRTVLPRPSPPFAGQIGRTWEQSRPDFPKPLSAPEGAPNVLLVLTDDTGFGHASTFGGGAATPALERLAANGLRYNRFHTTALCSPTRAALLTGRNHHSVGTGVIMEMATVIRVIPASSRTAPQDSRRSCASTDMPPAASASGTTRPRSKSAQPDPSSAGRPAAHGASNTSMASWPAKRINIIRCSIATCPPSLRRARPSKAISFSEDLADETIAWINSVKATDPKKPWFVYFCHARRA